MSSAWLGVKWRRRIERTIGEQIALAVGRGGYWHDFVTPDHRHGQIHAVSLDVEWGDPSMHYSSCREIGETGRAQRYEAWLAGEGL